MVWDYVQLLLLLSIQRPHTPSLHTLTSPHLNTQVSVSVPEIQARVKDTEYRQLLSVAGSNLAEKAVLVSVNKSASVGAETAILMSVGK